MVSENPVELSVSNPEPLLRYPIQVATLVQSIAA